MASTFTAEFKVTEDTSGIDQGQWIWDLAETPGLKRCALDSLFGYLDVEGSRSAVDAVRQFCQQRGFPEVSTHA